jgi:hypothetical protein
MVHVDVGRSGKSIWVIGWEYVWTEDVEYEFL